MKNNIIKQLILIMAGILSISQLHAATLITESFLKNINTDGDETSCAVTADNKYFIFARKAKNGNSDLFFSQYKKGKWTEAEAAAALNSDSDELSPYISPDGKFILFSSDRPGSLKNSSSDKPSFDIYYSERKNGVWEKPELLFGAVNTKDDELNPFITKKGNLLYFLRSKFDDSSKSKIIKVYNREDSWEDISTAAISKNSVVDIYVYKNSIFRSGSYITGFKKGEASNRKVFFSDDSENVIIELKGLADSGDNPGDVISITELNKDSVIISSKSSDGDDSYNFYIKKIGDTIKNSLPKTLSVKIEPGNYSNPAGIKVKVLFFSSLKNNSWPVKTEVMSPDSSGMIGITYDTGIKRVLILPGESDMNPFATEFLTAKENIRTATIQIGQAEEKEFAIKPLYFDFNSSEIQTPDILYLHEMIEYLRKNENLKLSIEGYSDGVGSYKANLDISRRRAERVGDYLVKAGISKNRIETKGLGYVKNKTTDTAQFNRRVEPVIISE